MTTETLFSSALVVQATEIGQHIVGALLIALAGLWLSGRVERWVARLTDRSERIDSTLGAFFASLAKYAVIAFALIAAIDLLGVETTSIIAVLGAMGFAIGLAMQGTLGNVASGVMLLMFRPFKVGDFVDAGGTSGTVKSITLFATEMATPDNVKIVVPNGAIWGGTVRNYGAYGTRRLDLGFGIGYEDDINKAMNVIEEMVKADSRVHENPEPLIAVGELASSSVNLVVRVWCASGDYWPLKFDLTKAVKEAFDRHGINIPYPQQVVRHIGAPPEEAA